MTNDKVEATFHPRSYIKMCWFDMETTGLEARLDVPLELGMVLTDEWGESQEDTEWKTLVWEEDDKIFQEGVKRGHHNDFVRNMHQKSGLWKDLRTFEPLTRDRADTAAVSWLKSQGVKQGELAMSGNSIGSLDRPFALIHFPKLNAFLSYRNIDMSSIKELVRLTNPGLYENLKPIIGDKSMADHRVLGDCYAAIREYQAYLDNYLIVED